MDDSDFLSGLDDITAFLAAGAFPLEAVLKETQNLEKAVSAFDRIQTAAVFGGLLTCPELQCNCCRLEALSHLVVALGNHRNQAAPKSSVAEWFRSVGMGICGRIEDPAEDVFVSAVTTTRGTFRVLEGTWESAGFYLQRILHVIETLPSEGEFERLKGAVHALLQVSDLVCARSQLHRYQLGSRDPLESLPKYLTDNLKACARRVTISNAELRSASIDLQGLDAFILDSRFPGRIITRSSLVHSPLVQHPLLEQSGRIIVALPTAISIAIRSLCIGFLRAHGMGDQLSWAIAREYARHFTTFPPLGIPRGAPVTFESNSLGIETSYGLEVDSGRWVQFHYVVDNLENFEQTGFAMPATSVPGGLHSFDESIDKFRSSVSRRPGFKRGLTIVVGCGMGRPERYVLSKKARDEWDVVYLNAADLTTLTWLGDVKPLTLFRILDAQRKLEAKNIDFGNMNGLPNLIAYIRSLGGHLVPHNQVPSSVGEGHGLHVVLDSSYVRDIRVEATVNTDRHSVQDVDGNWVEVQKPSSLFDEDRRLSLYMASDFDKDGDLPIVFEGLTSVWWCKVPFSNGFDRWKMLATWLPKVAAALEGRLSALPQRLLITVRFEGRLAEREVGHCVTFEDIRQAMRVNVDVTRSTVNVVADGTFEDGLASPENIAESALVEALVDGVRQLAGSESDPSAESLRRIVVSDPLARDGHVFYAREFRDIVQHPLSEKVISVDEIDSAAIRLGLGARVQGIFSAEIIGKADCCRFLNQLVATLEDDLCTQLQSYDRLTLLEHCLNNYEAAASRRNIWRRTAGANLALRNDKAAALATLAEQESKMNSALLGARLVAEVAICECRLTGGVIAGELDLSRMLAQVLLIHAYGGWSDAIYLDAMPPRLLVTPLGDIHGDLSFFDTIVEPFHLESHSTMVQTAISGYAKHFEQSKPTKSVESLFDPEFVAAWKGEFAYSIDEYRRVADEIEDYAIQAGLSVVRCPRSKLFELCQAAVDDPVGIIERLTMVPRSTWRTIPSGFHEKDRRLWRFKRRLSLLRLPILQVDDGADPTLLVAPGMLRESIVHMVSCYYEGSFPHYQLKSSSMKAWPGRIAHKRGTEFARMVANELRRNGWTVETEVTVKQILGMRFDTDYGDVDVLAYDAARSRILVVECKDLLFHKTAGELAEQLRDFRGMSKDGKRDELKRHLDRGEVLAKYADKVRAYLGATNKCSIELWVVFRNTVPMVFAWKEFQDRVKITTYGKLSEL